MSKKQTKVFSEIIHTRQGGFTIVEVLIVLALVSLLMLIIFLAVPAMQRNQRNNSRKNDASLLYAAVTECFNQWRTFDRCNEVSELPLDPDKLGYSSGVHFGAACTDWLNLGCAQYPPTLDEPNWLNHLTCIDGSSLGASTAYYDFVVGYMIEAPGAPATPPHIPAGAAGRCLP